MVYLRQEYAVHIMGEPEPSHDPLHRSSAAACRPGGCPGRTMDGENVLLRADHHVVHELLVSIVSDPDTPR